jgi:hypothetical protein
MGLTTGIDMQQDQCDETENPDGRQNAQATSRFGDGFRLRRSRQLEIRQLVQLAPLPPVGEPANYHAMK